MARRSKGFYKDFEVFISDVAKEKSNRKKLSSSWLFAIGNVVGLTGLVRIIASIPMSIAGAGISLSFIAGITGMLGAVTIPLTAITIATGALMRMLSKASAEADRDRDMEQLKKAKIIFQDLQFLRESDPKASRQGLNNLFENLVAGNKISL